MSLLKKKIANNVQQYAMLRGGIEAGVEDRVIISAMEQFVGELVDLDDNGICISNQFASPEGITIEQMNITPHINTKQSIVLQNLKGLYTHLQKQTVNKYTDLNLDNHNIQISNQIAVAPLNVTKSTAFVTKQQTRVLQNLRELRTHFYKHGIQ
tara:strand:+ start:374 stop:835 length:462 start_codon:yes stop_codon:yes gene_type:complete